jgi:hypothetical protein
MIRAIKRYRLVGDHAYVNHYRSEPLAIADLDPVCLGYDACQTTATPVA